MLYGGAEFSRDTDLVILADTDNLARLRHALEHLQAECIAVPPLETHYLQMGLAVHFRCHHPDADGMRVDVMSRLRGVDVFPDLWSRRTTIQLENESLELVSLPDLVLSKKTQRDKDWPMIARLVEANYFSHQDQPTSEQIEFWLGELRTASLLREAVDRFPEEARQVLLRRPLLQVAKVDPAQLEVALRAEEDEERKRDQEYWLPLKQELERLRRSRRPKG